jgi:acyl-CoA hydrolase
MARDFNQMYKEKVRTAAEVAKLVKSGDWIDLGMFNGKSVAFERELAARKDELNDVRVYVAVCMPPIPEVLMKDPKGESFTYIDYHYSPVSRYFQQARPNVFYNPTQFGESEGWFELKYDEPDKIGTRHRDWTVYRVCPMDKDGNFNFGLQNGITLAQFMTSKTRVVEICPICLIVTVALVRASMSRMWTTSLKKLLLFSIRNQLFLQKVTKPLRSMSFLLSATAAPFSWESAVCPMLWVKSLLIPI